MIYICTFLLGQIHYDSKPKKKQICQNNVLIWRVWGRVSNENATFTN
jgi:hypothetical protein